MKLHRLGVISSLLIIFSRFGQSLPELMAVSSSEKIKIMAGMSTGTNGQVKLHLTLPDDVGRYVEIFETQDLIYISYYPWTVAARRIPTFGKSHLIWHDPSSAKQTHKYYIFSDADIDTDGDGFSDLREQYISNTNPNVFDHHDADNDRMHDWYETILFGNLRQRGYGDFDGDGLRNDAEMVYQTSGYGAPKVTVYSDPSLYDSDNDGMHDGIESGYSFLDPLDPSDSDYDRDGLSNWIEHQIGSNLQRTDTDGDQLDDGNEYTHGLDPTQALPSDMSTDSDGDGMTNGYEVANSLDPFNASDKSLDGDHDGLDNFWEYTNGLAAGQWDTDGDTLPDAVEVEWNTDPRVADDLGSDADGDGLVLSNEYHLGTNPLIGDSDGDGVSDGDEAEQGSSPSNGSDGGTAPEPHNLISLTLTIGDHSGSHSEIYEMTLSGERTTRLHSGSYGNVETQTFTFLKGNSYTLNLRHVGTDPNFLEDNDTPDYDYTATVSGTGNSNEDLNRILGRHEESAYFYAAGKTATVHVPKITLNLSKTLMTLKHDNPCNLEIITEPAGLSFTDHGFEIKFTDALPWRSLGSGKTMTWTTGIAGNFTLKAKAKINRTGFYSEEKTAAVQFPTRSQILSDAGIVSAMDAEWQQTLVDSTPSSYIEHGFIILLDSRTGNYSVDRSRYGASAVTPGEQAMGAFFVEWENPDDIFPTSGGVNYTVALFHTHPPFTHANPNIYESRDTGPSTGSGEDINQAFNSELPGFVHDYTAPIIYPGHPENDAYKSYEYGPDRRSRL